jgi:plasmid stabilization system protein ParE
VNLTVRTAPDADDHIRQIDEWWRTSRPSAPDLFLEELAASFETIGHTPQIGRLYRPSPIAGTRRLLLRGARYHVYYVVTDEAAIVLAVWHASRGAGPPLRLG